ncbi:MAG: glycosyltransferase, partial [Flavobacteriales bacterium]|nr:glycosyltransferase [Flavobacteriales bacterium]
MKIAIASTFHPYRGGIAQFNDALAIALRTEGHMVNCFNWSRQYPAILFPGVAQTKSGTSTPPRSTSAPLDSISPNSWRKTAKIILCDEGVDVLILPFWHSALAPALRGVARSIKRLSPETKVIAIMHNATSHDGKASDKWLTRRFLKRVDNVVTLSTSVTQDVRKLAPDLSIKTLFHPLYDDLPNKPEKKMAREKLGIPVNAKNVVLFFGLIRPYKGLAVLLKAANLLSEDTHLIIAGECYGSWGKYEKIINVSKAKSRIHVFNRFIPDEQLG